MSVIPSPWQSEGEEVSDVTRMRAVGVERERTRWDPARRSERTDSTCPLVRARREAIGAKKSTTRV